MDERNNLEDASAEMLEALDLVEKSHMLIQKAEYDEAERLLARAEDTEPMCSRIYLERGGLRVMQSDYYGAIDQYKRCLLINKEDPEALYMMGNTYLLLEDFENAVNAYAKADKQGYQSMHLLNNMGYCAEKKGDYDTALRSYQRAIDENPQWYVPYLRKVACLMVMRKVDQAEQEAREAVRIFPNVADCRIELARTLTAQFKMQEAEAVLREGTAQFPDDLQLKLMLMDNSIAMNRTEEAEKIVGDIRAMEDIPPEVLSHVDKTEAEAYLRAEKTDKAIECFERCVERDTPEEPDVDARTILMTLYRTMEEWDKLQAISADSLKTSRANNELCSGYAMEAIAADHLGHKEEAAILYKEGIRKLTMIAIKDRARVDTHVYRIMCHIGLNEFDKAYEELEYVQKATGDEMSTKELRAQILRAEGRIAEAEKLEGELKTLFKALRKGLQDGQ